MSWIDNGRSPGKYKLGDGIQLSYFIFQGFGDYDFSDLSLPLVYSQSKEANSSISIADRTF